MVIAVVAVAYGTQAPQLGVAEFAPAARRALEAPPTTASSSPRAGVTGSRRTTTTTSVVTTGSTADTDNPGNAPTTRAARARTCVGNPPRQIEDPMSPPCVAAIFEGDNGGASAPGVTATEITVVVPTYSDTAVVDKAEFEALFAFFNRRFEFYGRRLRPVIVPFDGRGDAVKQRSGVSDMLSQNPFAVVMPREVQTGAPQELARQKTLAITTDAGRQTVADRVLFDPAHPYVWSAYPSLETLSRNLSDLVCTALAGRVAHHAGSNSLRQATRKFGVIAATDAGGTLPSTAPLQAGLDACDAPYELGRLDTSRDAAAQIRTTLESFQAHGVTTMICLCLNQTVGTIGNQAQQLVASGFLPEWLYIPMFGGDLFSPTFEMTNEQRASLIGFIPHGKARPEQTLTWFQALLEESPELAGKILTRFYAYVQDLPNLYLGLLMLATGVQGAGPNLTADSFAAALTSTQFANPGAGQAPYWQPSVGFGPGDHGFINDYTVAWWNPALVPPSATWAMDRGSWCYVGRGSRYQAGSFPRDLDDHLFTSMSSADTC